MVIRNVLISEIIEFLGDDVKASLGNTEGLWIDNITNVERVNERSLDWINPAKQNKQDIAERSKAKSRIVEVLMVWFVYLSRARPYTWTQIS